MREIEAQTADLMHLIKNPTLVTLPPRPYRKSKDIFFDNQVAEAERRANAKCTCSIDDIKDGTPCDACSERFDNDF